MEGTGKAKQGDLDSPDNPRVLIPWITEGTSREALLSRRRMALMRAR